MPQPQAKAADLFSSWAELDEAGIRAIVDDGGKTLDRYTVVFRDGDMLGLSDNPTHPLGFSQWCGEGGSDQDIAEWVSSGQKLVTDPPEWMQQHLLARMNEAYRDGIQTALDAGRDIGEIREKIFAECFTSARYEPAPALTP